MSLTAIHIQRSDNRQHVLFLLRSRVITLTPSQTSGVAMYSDIAAGKSVIDQEYLSRSQCVVTCFIHNQVLGVSHLTAAQYLDTSPSQINS